MRCHFRLPPAILAFCCAIATLSHGQEVTAKTELDLGIQASKQAKYEEAITHFKQALALDPTSVPAHLYLATAYAQQYIPGADVADNNQVAQQALDEFEKVLSLHPTRDQEVSSLKNMASLYSNMNKLETAKEYHKKVITIDPDVPETYFSIGVINWTEAYQPRMEQRARLNLKSADPLINAEGCWNVRAANEEHIKEGIEMFTTAISLRPDYDDYMNLMYRERADIQCDNRESYDADIKTAVKWVDLTINTKKAKFEAAPAKLHEK